MDTDMAKPHHHHGKEQLAETETSSRDRSFGSNQHGTYPYSKNENSSINDDESDEVLMSSSKASSSIEYMALQGSADEGSVSTGRCSPLLKDSSSVEERMSAVGAMDDGPDAIEYLKSQGFTFGLASAMIRNCTLFPLRIWLIDNSGSMVTADVHRLVQSKGSSGRLNTVDCTRWEEVTTTVEWHARLSATVRAPAIFRLLSDPGKPHSQQISVCERRDYGTDPKNEVRAVSNLMRGTRPAGLTPLTSHLHEIRYFVEQMAPSLLAQQKLIAIVIVTDGIPATEDGIRGEDASVQFMDSLRQFSGLPVWLVVRLSTKERRVINFYNDVDERITASGDDVDVDILADYMTEACEVHLHNPWLNYALPLHLCRESGVNFAVFDALDNRRLHPTEVGQFCALLFELRFTSLSSSSSDRHHRSRSSCPDPTINWSGFSLHLQKVVEKEKRQWNPMKQRLTPWIDFAELDRIYSSSPTPGTPCCTLL